MNSRLVRSWKSGVCDEDEGGWVEGEMVEGSNEGHGVGDLGDGDFSG